MHDHIIPSFTGQGTNQQKINIQQQSHQIPIIQPVEEKPVVKSKTTVKRRKSAQATEDAPPAEELQAKVKKAALEKVDKTSRKKRASGDAANKLKREGGDKKVFVCVL